MKKILTIAIISLLFAVPAFAETTFDNGIAITAPNGEAISTLSNKVDGAIISNGEAFAAATKHASGSKQFGTSSESTKIFSEPSTTLTGLTKSDSSDFGDWTPL